MRELASSHSLSNGVPILRVRPMLLICSDNRIAANHTKLQPIDGDPQTRFNAGNDSPLKVKLSASGDLPEPFTIVNMASYASLEYGVAKLEVLYQEDLKCIAMSSDGWRCPETISKYPLLEARRFVKASSSSDAVLEIGLLLGLILCDGHSRGQLPQLYTEKWAHFLERRLSKNEAISKFNANNWLSFNFFGVQDTLHVSMPSTLMRPRSASSIHISQTKKDGEVSEETWNHPVLTPRPRSSLGSQKRDVPSFPFEFTAGSYHPSSMPKSGKCARDPITKTES